MRRTNSIIRGAAPRASVPTVELCVVTVTIFVAEVWWPVIACPTAKGTVTPPTSHLCSLIDKNFLVALRVALSVWRTTPKVVRVREGGIPSTHILSEGYRLRIAERHNSLDNCHLLRWGAIICSSMGSLKFKSKSRLSKRHKVQISRAQRALR